MNRTYHGNHFFILSKGINAGKPMCKPCPNCFVVITKCSKERDLLYWLCLALWQGQYFHPYLVGSVIPFLRLFELKSIILKTRSQVRQQPEVFLETVVSLKKLDRCRDRIELQLQLIDQVKKGLMWKMMRSRESRC